MMINLILRSRTLGFFKLLAIFVSCLSNLALAQQTDVVRAEHLYSQTCAYCHSTGVGPALKGRNLPPDVFIFFVRHGNQGMPAFRPSDISDADLRLLADYLSKSAVPAQAQATPGVTP